MKNLFENLIPPPERITIAGGMQRLPLKLKVTFSSGISADTDSLSRFIAAVMPTAFSRGRPVQFELSTKQIRGVPANLSDQAYDLTIGKKITLIGGGESGLRYGIQTLRQILEDAEDVGTIPNCRIVDWPRIKDRGIHFDLAREMEYRPAYLKRVVENLSYLKMNTLHMYLENKFVYPSAPEVAPFGAMTPKQAKDLCKYAKVFGITVIPQISTLGHMEHLLNGPYSELREDPASSFNLCPTHPKARQFLVGLIADVADAFQSPFIHIGYDESHSGVCARCAKHGSPQEILAEHLNWLNAEVKKHGARTMIYGDKFLSREEFPRADAANGGTPDQAHAALKPVNRDIIITDWHYTAPYGGTLEYLINSGFEVQIASATNLYWHDAIPLHRGHHWIVETMDQAIKQGVTGGFNTNWAYWRGQFLENFWYFEGLAAERMWTSKPHGYESWGKRFASRFWGVEDDFYSEIAGQTETTQTARCRAFLDCHVLAVDIPASLDQAVFDFAEIGENVVALVRKFRKAARRNADTLRILDMPGQIIRYIGARAVQGMHLSAALKRGDRKAALLHVETIRKVASEVAARLADGYKIYGGAVVDRDRIALHIRQLDEYAERIKKAEASKLPSLAPAEYLNWLQRQAPDPMGFIRAYTASFRIAAPDDISKAQLPAEGTHFERASCFDDEHFADIRRFHGVQDGMVYIKGVVNIPRAGKGKLLFGVDGPVKIWINGKEAAVVPNARNPAVADKYSCDAEWRQGENEVLFALNTNHGLAWGVLARWQM